MYIIQLLIQYTGTDKIYYIIHKLFYSFGIFECDHLEQARIIFLDSADQKATQETLSKVVSELFSRFRLQKYCGIE